MVQIEIAEAKSCQRQVSGQLKVRFLVRQLAIYYITNNRLGDTFNQFPHNDTF